MIERQRHSFKSGKIVSPKDFVGRENEIHTIFARIHNHDSTAVVGEPQIGKSSLLRYIAHEQVWADWLGATAEQYCFIEIDCYLLPPSYQPSQFWKHVLDHIEATFHGDWLRIPLEVVRNSFFGSLTLKQLFDILAREDRCVVLLIDQFDTLLHHPNFNTAEFFGSLRSISTSVDSLSLVTASRMSVTEMQRRSQEINPLGSPFFNNLITVRLPHLTSEQVDQVLDQALDGTMVQFSLRDRDYIRRVTGQHPYLVQIAGAGLFEMIISRKKRDLSYKDALHTLQNQAFAYFADLWRHLSVDTRQVMAILASAELRRHGSADKIARLERYDSECSWLADGGFIESIDDQRCAVWRDKRWRISAQSFAEWIVNNVRAGSLEVGDTPQPIDRTKLRQILSVHFDEDELRILCFDLRVDYQNLPGEGKANKAMELIAYCERSSRLPELIATARQHRPNAPW